MNRFRRMSSGSAAYLTAQRSGTRSTALLCAACLVSLVPFVVSGHEGPAESGPDGDDARQIVAETQRRATSRSQRYIGRLESFDAGGRAREKRWTYERIGSHGQSKSLIRFTEPADVRGVALLIVNHPDRASDQWMWTPAIERERRIALQDRSTRFFGTDFSFEDLEERDVDQDDYRLLGEEEIGGVPCWKIQSAPGPSRTSQYSRSIIWIRKDLYTAVRIDAYAGDDVVRRRTYADIRNVQGIWTARETTMADLRRGSHTRLTLDEIEYDVPLRDADFTVQALRRQ
jgi:hypothetical protein